MLPCADCLTPAACCLLLLLPPPQLLLLLLHVPVQAKREAEGGVAAKRRRIELPVLDADRVLPDNFDPSCQGAYMALPPEALPRRPCSGKFGFNIPQPPGCKGQLEVRLREQAFCLRKGSAAGATKEAAGAKEKAAAPRLSLTPRAPSSGACMEGGAQSSCKTIYIPWSTLPSVKEAYVCARKALGWPPGDLE